MSLPVQPNLLVYRRFYQRYHYHSLPFFIFGSSSRGNSVYLKPFHTLVDIGLSVKAYRHIDPAFFYHVKYVIITHHHGDHLKPATLSYLLTTYPNIKIIMQPRLYYYLQSAVFYRRRFMGLRSYLDNYSSFILFNRPLTLSLPHQKRFTIKPYTVSHGSLCNLAIEFDGQQRWLYSTDLDSVYGNLNRQVTGLPLNVNKPFDIIMLEANYDRDLVKNVICQQQSQGSQVYAKQNLRHLSEQESFKYANSMLKSHGLYVPLHASRGFGNYSQDVSIQK